jgi:hypothetical protein
VSLNLSARMPVLDLDLANPSSACATFNSRNRPAPRPIILSWILCAWKQERPNTNCNDQGSAITFGSKSRGYLREACGSSTIEFRGIFAPC